MEEIQTRFDNDVVMWLFSQFQDGFTNKKDNTILDGFDITLESFWRESSYFENIFSHCDSDLFIDDDGMFSFQTTKEERDNIILGNDKDILIQRNY